MTLGIYDEFAEALRQERLALRTLVRDEGSGSNRHEALRRWECASARVSAAAMSLKQANAVAGQPRG